MKKLLILTFLSYLSSIVALGQDFSGRWSGFIEAQGQKLTIVFDISYALDNDSYSAKLISPDQNNFKISVTRTTVAGDTISMSIPELGIEYRGVMDGDRTIEGEFVQNWYRFDLRLRIRPEEALKKEGAVRPQEPVGPFPYTAREVVFENPEAGIKLSGTLTVPNGGGRIPYVVLVTGSGAQNRDSEILGHKPFWVIADFLSRNGIGVLRYDDRGVGGSEGDYAVSTTADLSTDAEAAVRYLRESREITPSEVGIIGHSEGGVIAPMVAARNSDVDFVVLLAGPGVDGGELILRQQEDIYKLAGMPNDYIAENALYTAQIIDMARHAEDLESFRSLLKVYIDENIDDLAKLNGIESETLSKIYLAAYTPPWFFYFLRHDPAEELRRVHCPVLALNGSRDIQVASSVNLEAIRKALEAGGNQSFITKEIPDLNHLFQECVTGGVEEYGKLEQTFSPVVLNIILEWIKGEKQGGGIR